MGPKKKGIVMQSVKEVLQSLVDDNLVCFEKIGTSNYFWSFPSTALQTVSLAIYIFVLLALIFKQRKNKINQLNQEVEKVNLQIVDCEKQIEQSEIGREETV